MGSEGKGFAKEARGLTVQSHELHLCVTGAGVGVWERECIFVIPALGTCKKKDGKLADTLV